LVLITISLSLAALFISPFDPYGLKIQRLARWWGRSLLFISGVQVQVEGLEHLTPGQPYVFAANHRSQFDIFVLLVVLPGNFLFVAKKSLFRIPIFGQALARMGSVPIDRSNRQEAIKSLNQAVGKVKQGFSMMVFPEGTRASSRELLPFKKGVFIMALRAGQPVVPVVINGTLAIQPRGALRLRPGPIQVIISPPIAAQDFNRKEDLMDAVRQAIAAHFNPDYPRQ
jgi:1-acyl-sn-glycerol-3-phosphate acyltransferase